MNNNIINEQIAILQCYIHQVKGLEVNVSVPRNARQLQLLNKAYIIALNYLYE